MTSPSDFTVLLIGFLLSVFTFSLILGDNWLFRLSSAVLSGALAGYLINVLIENIFIPSIVNPLMEPNVDWKNQALAVVVIISAVFLFLKYYFRSPAGGNAILAVLLCSAAAITILGIVNGTLINLYRGLIARFLPGAEMSSANIYWVKTGIITLGVISSLIYTQHYAFGKKNGKEISRQRNTVFFFRTLGEVFIGIAMGAVFAGCFIASSTILIGQISNLVGSGQEILQWVK
ncbi:MAG: hypothetical protein BWY58_01667 [Chloroflexi bacterium ADurb.Bin344]|nr:MAG: hypothetical protein BWY58_01667 [Chloroflexi bacterium ADurb.Bin344]